MRHQVLARAQSLMAVDRYGEAAAALSQGLSFDPTDSRMLLLLAQCEMALKNPAKALGHARQAVANAPEDDQARFVLGMVMIDQNKTKEAEKLARDGLVMDPESADLFYLLGWAQYSQSRYKESLSSAMSALAIDPEHDGALSLRTQCKTLLRHRDVELSSQEHMALAPEGIALAVHANMLLRQGRTREAYEAFRTGLREDPDDEYLRTGLKEAIRARFVLYRWLLIYWTWVAGFGKYGWFIILGVLVLRRASEALARNFPNAQWVFIPIGAIATFLIWGHAVMRPVLDALLLMHPFGRYAMDRAEKWSGRYWLFSATCLLLAGGFALLGMTAAGIGLAIIGAIVWVFTGMAQSMANERNRLIVMHAANGIVIAIGGIVTVVSIVSPRSSG